MYTKNELMSMGYEALVDIANAMNLDCKKFPTVEDISYAILDEQAETASSKLAEMPKHRGRKTKKELELMAAIEQKSSEGEDAPKAKNASAKAEKKPTKSAEKAAAVKATKDETAEATTTPVAEKAPRKRVTKKTVEAVASESATTVNPASAASVSATSVEAVEAVAQAVSDPDAVWAGDPGDGTDFIVVQDVTADMYANIFASSDSAAEMPGTEPATYAEPAQTAQPTKPSRESKHSSASDDQAFDALLVDCNGVVELMPDGYGFLRSSDYNYLSSPDDIFIGTPLIRKHGLRTGDVVQGKVRMQKDGEQFFALASVEMINGRLAEEVRDRVAFEHLTPLFPDQKFTLNGGPSTNMSTRIVDLFSPIGKGQRALIVAQPKTGKTILMKDIANAIAENHPEAYLMMLLIDERPEEVTDMARTVNAEVIASTFDEPAERHVKIAGLVLEKAKRLVECGHDVVIFLDSITRLARAYNTVAPASGKVLTGGVDANALQKPKRFFGAARNIEGGGSLTIIATALIDTGSKMDEVIFEEFKGTGNMELQLDRALSNKRIFPSVNLIQSSTRRDDLLQDETTLNRMWVLRKFIADMNPLEAIDAILDRMKFTKDNEEFLLSMNG